ncbi:MAG: hypothetical protein MUO76_11220 [Anaerolineaceae bacterium]|nr:hypothetical protein [Anaerolineaceae bacterium]
MIRSKYLPEHGLDKILPALRKWLLFIDVLEISQGTADYIDQVLARYRRHADNLSRDWEMKMLTRYQTIEIAKKKYPHLGSELRKYKSDLLISDAVHAFFQKKYSAFIKNTFKSIILSYPWFVEWLRLPIRELKIIIAGKSRNDPYLDILKKL